MASQLISFLSLFFHYLKWFQGPHFYSYNIQASHSLDHLVSNDLPPWSYPKLYGHLEFFILETMNFSLFLSLQLILTPIPIALTLQPYKDLLDPSIFLQAWLPISLLIYSTSYNQSLQTLWPIFSSNFALKTSALNPCKDFFLLCHGF